MQRRQRYSRKPAPAIPTRIPLYNDGLAIFYVKRKRTGKFNTPIHGKFEPVEQFRDWFRTIGISSTENFHAHSLQTRVDMRIAININTPVQSDWGVEIDEKHYTIYRVFHNPSTSEYEISLTEVPNDIS